MDFKSAMPSFPSHNPKTDSAGKRWCITVVYNFHSKEVLAVFTHKDPVNQTGLFRQNMLWAIHLKCIQKSVMMI